MRVGARRKRELLFSLTYCHHSLTWAVVVDRLCRDVEMLNACVEIPTFSRGNYLSSL